MPADGAVLVTRDSDLAAQVGPLCAAAGQALTVVSGRAELQRGARKAAVLLLDSSEPDLIELSGVGAEQVVVLTRDPDELDSWRVAVQVGARAVVTLPRDAGRLVDLLALAREHTGASGPLVAVMGATGGVGASTLAVALGLAATAAGGYATLADFDAAGGGVDLLVGLERSSGLRWPELAAARGVIPSTALRERLPAVASLSVLSCARGGPQNAPLAPGRDAACAVVAAARRGNAAVIADLPRWSSDAADVVVTTCDALLLMVRAEVRSVAAAGAAISQLAERCDDIRVVLRTDRATRLDARRVAAALSQPVVVTVGPEPRLASAADRGELHRVLPRSRLGAAATTLWDQLTRVHREDARAS